MELQTLKKNIVFHMVKELSTMGYAYDSIVEGCFDASQRFTSLIVPGEHIEQFKKECVSETIELLKRI